MKQQCQPEIACVLPMVTKVCLKNIPYGNAHGNTEQRCICGFIVFDIMVSHIGPFIAKMCVFILLYNKSCVNVGFLALTLDIPNLSIVCFSDIT